MASERGYNGEVDVAHRSSKYVAKLPAEGADDLVQPLMRFDSSTFAVVQRRLLTFLQSFQRPIRLKSRALILLPILPSLLAQLLVIRRGGLELLLFRQPWIGLHGCMLRC